MDEQKSFDNLNVVGRKLMGLPHNAMKPIFDKLPTRFIKMYKDHMRPKEYLQGKNLHAVGMILGPLVFLLSTLTQPFGPDHEQLNHLLAIILLMVIFWFTEAIPIAVTSLIPFISFPIFGIAKAKDIAPFYMSSTLFLFMGGFLMSLAMEKWNLHKRIALHVILRFNRSHSQIVLGFMITSALLSMWISNTATAAMMLPICLALLKQVGDQEQDSKSFSKALLIGVAWACSLGGIATTVGTPPNLFFLQMYRDRFPMQPEISIGSWMRFGFPLSFILVGVAWIILTRIQFRISDNKPLPAETLRSQLESLGPLRFEEKAVAAVFITLITLWVFRLDIDLGFMTIPGWSHVLTNGKFLDDGSVAILCASILFLIPTQQNDSRILTSEIIGKIPWDIILLFGGGFALAEGFEKSGMSNLLAQKLQILEGFPILAMLLIVALVITFLSEVASNVSIAQVTLPIVIPFAQNLGEKSTIPLMLTATLAASMGFMLPIATAPNAIMFSSRRFAMWEMTKGGFVLNCVSALVISLIIYMLFLY